MPVTDDNGGAPRQITNRNVWDELANLRRDTADARHDQTDRITKVIAEEARATRVYIESIESRVRTVENTLAATAPSTLGQRLGDTEKWQAVLSSANLPNRVDHIEGTLDQMRGSLNVLKYVQIVLAIAAAGIAVVSFLRPVVPS